jgi:hypothetical protein
MTIGLRMGKKVFNSEASKEYKDIELSSISLFKAHGIIYIIYKIIVNKSQKIHRQVSAIHKFSLNTFFFCLKTEPTTARLLLKL